MTLARTSIDLPHGGVYAGGSQLSGICGRMVFTGASKNPRFLSAKAPSSKDWHARCIGENPQRQAHRFSPLRARVSREHASLSNQFANVGKGRSSSCQRQPTVEKVAPRLTGKRGGMIGLKLMAWQAGGSHPPTAEN